MLPPSIALCAVGARVPRGTQLDQADLAVSQELRSLVFQMLEVDSSLRPSAAELNRQIGAMFEAHPEWNAPMERTSPQETIEAGEASRRDLKPAQHCLSAVALLQH